MRRAGSAVTLGLAAALLVTGCGSPGPASGPPETSPPAPTPAPTLAPTGTPPAPSAPSPTAGVLPTAPPGTAFADIPEAGIRLPVPVGWESIGAEALADPATREVLTARYPGSGKLLGALDQLGGRAEPVFLAADPSPASLASALAPNISVLVAQPPVGGVLLDLAATFIADGLTDVLGAIGTPASDKVQLPAGEAIRLRYTIPAAGGEEGVAVAWVIGAPRGTLLVTVMGSASVLGDLDPDALAAAIVLSPQDAP